MSKEWVELKEKLKKDPIGVFLEGFNLMGLSLARMSEGEVRMMIALLRMWVDHFSAGYERWLKRGRS